MKVDIVTDEIGFRGLESVWNPLLTRSGVRNIFLTFEWLSTWWKHFGHRHRLSIAVVRRGGEIVALFPLMITIREGFRQLGMISQKTSPYKDFIIDEGQDHERIIGNVLGALVDFGGWDLLLLNGFSEDSVNFRAFQEASPRFSGSRTIWRKTEVSLSIPLEGTYDKYWEGLSKNFRKNISRLRKRLPKESKFFWYEDDLDEDKLACLIDKIIDINAFRWVEVKGQYSAFGDPLTRIFYKDLASCFFRKGWLRLPAMIINGEIAAIDLCFKYENKYIGVITGYEPRFSNYSPGNLLIVHTIEKSYKEGLTEYDLLTGDEPYKYQFNPKERRIFTVGFFPQGMKAYVAFRWFFGIRPYLERMEKSPLKKCYWWYRKRSVPNG